MIHPRQFLNTSIDIYVNLCKSGRQLWANVASLTGWLLSAVCCRVEDFFRYTCSYNGSLPVCLLDNLAREICVWALRRYQCLLSCHFCMRWNRKSWQLTADGTPTMMTMVRAGRAVRLKRVSERERESEEEKLKA